MTYEILRAENANLKDDLFEAYCIAGKRPRWRPRQFRIWERRLEATLRSQVAWA